MLQNSLGKSQMTPAMNMMDAPRNNVGWLKAAQSPASAATSSAKEAPQFENRDGGIEICTAGPGVPYCERYDLYN